MFDLLKSLDNWCYMMLAGIILVGLSCSIIGNGQDKKQRLLLIKFNQIESVGKALIGLIGQPAQIMNGRVKPIMLAIGLALCLIAYIIIIATHDIHAFIVFKPLTGGLFLIPVILLLVTILLSLRIFFTRLTLYSNALIVQTPLQRKIYYFDDFENLEVCVYADRQISYRAFRVSKTKGNLKLWLRKQADFQLVQNVFKENACVAEIVSDRLDTPYYVRLKELQNA